MQKENRSCKCPHDKKKQPLQFKRGTARAFRRDNPILSEGQPAVELDTFKMKIGNGYTKYRDLPYISEGTPGPEGKSTYQLWKEQGGRGTVDDFLDSLVGSGGESAYEI